MSRKNSEVNPLVKQLIEKNKIKSDDDAQSFMKNIFKAIISIFNIIREVLTDKSKIPSIELRTSLAIF